MTGRFITIEGIEGVGKSTNIAFMQQILTAHNIPFVITREPGGTQLAEQIRGLLLNYEEETVAEDTELLLMFAARAQHLARVIKPALAQSKWVISDRFTDATYAYQGGGRGISVDKIAALERWVQEELQPDLTLLLDISPAVGLARVQKQRDTLDRIEREQLDFFARVRAAYLQRAQQFKARYRIINAEDKLEIVQQQIKIELERFIICHSPI